MAKHGRKSGSMIACVGLCSCGSVVGASHASVASVPRMHAADTQVYFPAYTEQEIATILVQVGQGRETGKGKDSRHER